HPLHAGTDALRHPDAAAVVAVGAQPQCGEVEHRRVLVHHRRVVDEAACGEDDAGPGADCDALPVPGGDDADHPSAVVDHQPVGPGVVERAGTGVQGSRGQRRHQCGTAGLRALADVRPGCGAGDLVVGVGVLAAGVHQPLAVDRGGAAALGQPGAEEPHTAGHEPVVVLQAVVAVEVDLVLVDGRAACGLQETPHRLGVVVDPGGPLGRGATAEVEHPVGHRGGPTAGAGPLQDDDVRSGLDGLPRGA